MLEYKINKINQCRTKSPEKSGRKGLCPFECSHVRLITIPKKQEIEIDKIGYVGKILNTQ